VSLQANNAAVSVPASITIPAGSPSALFSASTSAVTATQSATITGSYGGVSQTAALSVTPISVTLQSIQCSPATVSGGNPAVCTVALSHAAPAVGVVVALSLS
jgi:hypothetical protein